MKYHFLIKTLFVFLHAGINFATAQETLSLSASLEAALKNNFSILISRNDQQIAGNNNSIGNAGMLPTLDVSAGVTNANLKTRQEYSNGNLVKQNGAQTDGLSAGAHFNWVLFDGLKMFASRSKLDAME